MNELLPRPLSIYERDDEVMFVAEESTVRRGEVTVGSYRKTDGDCLCTYVVQTHDEWLQLTDGFVQVYAGIPRTDGQRWTK